MLLAVHTLLTMKYISRHLEVLRGDDRLAFSATQGADLYSPGVTEAMPRLGVPTLPFEEAVRQPWDLALFATHGGAIFFRGAASKVHIQHGIGAGKRVEGSDFTYGRQWALWEGVPKYDIMLESSYSTMRRAVRAVPELAGHIAVVGDMFCDDVLAGMPHRDAFRAQLGIEPGQTAVLFMSTWGPHGLFRARGAALLHAAERLPAQYKVLVTMHNHLWSGRTDEPSPWSARLAQLPRERFVVCGPLADWVPYIVAADVAILDHGSLGLYYALTRKPAITIHVPDRVVTADAPATQLRARYPVLDRAADLQSVIELSLGTHRPQAVDRILPQITSFPGRAVQRTRSVLYQQLHLPPFRGPSAHLELR